MNSGYKTSLYSDAFRLTVVNFFREFYKLTLNAYICRPLLAAIAGTNDHKRLAGPTGRNRQSCEKFEISFEIFLGKVRNIFGSYGFS